MFSLPLLRIHESDSQLSFVYHFVMIGLRSSLDSGSKDDMRGDSGTNLNVSAPVVQPPSYTISGIVTV